eukprot:TRINITY_DN1547_c0_g1_i1.p1 TRINITY_DN1547_c0_g1~~TRINITY_DN1547_c0_g1_i1.p1  ORF type:complete len:515 (-),score=136.43 TRINITY_DN1547_c0_g1_i1:42-1514(-)
MGDQLTDEMKEAMAAGADEEVVEGGDEDEGEEEEPEAVDGMETLEERDEGEQALQLDHRLDKGKFHVGVSWVHLDGLTGRKEKYNGMKCLITSYGVRHPDKVKVRSAEKNDEGKFIALWVKRIHCRNTVHKDNGAWKATENPENTGATGAARWVALGRPEVDQMQGKLKFKKTPEEEQERAELFTLIDVNGNGMLSLAEIDKALPEVMGCVALFNAKPAIIRAFLAATGCPPASNDDAAFRLHAKEYVYPGEQFRKLLQYLHEFFEMYLIFQEMGDADADRRIDCKEFADFITSGNAYKVGIKVTTDMLEDKCGDTVMPGYSLFNEIDVDQGGCILFKEFSDYLIRQGLKESKMSFGEAEKLRGMFNSAKDGESSMSYGRFRKLLQKMGMPEDEIDEMITQADTNGNGSIDPDEFVDWLAEDDHRAGLERAQQAAADTGERLACRLGCGMMAAKGLSRSGKPLDTCCRGCAMTMGGGHDPRCAQEPVGGN